MSAVAAATLAVTWTAVSASSTAGAFTLTSPAVAADGRLPATYTCDGTSATMPLKWTHVPKGTKSFALAMHTIPPEGVPHYYWVAWDIPAKKRSITENAVGFGQIGGNSINPTIGYAPPCSKGPGDKTYTVTVYALSTSAGLGTSSASVSRDDLLQAISGITLGKAELNVVYSRP